MSLVDALQRVDALQAMLQGPSAARPPGAGTASGSFADLLDTRLAAADQPSSGPYEAVIREHAARNGVDPALVRAVVQHESGFDPGATSPAGAQGLMQLMPATARGLGVGDPYDPVQSIDGGSRYLREMLDRFGGDVRLALAAYNAGPGAVERYGGVPPYAETQGYVERVLGTYAQTNDERSLP